jgi:hypothetical protein
MRRLSILLLVTLAALLAGPSAQAAEVFHERVPVDDRFVNDQSCGFPVEVHITGVAIIIEQHGNDGSFRLFVGQPQIKATMTNLDTGETITVNISGPLHITEQPDGSFTAVETGLWAHRVNPETGEAGLFLAAGRRISTVDAEGNESVQFVGHVIDLCAELAA